MREANAPLTWAGALTKSLGSTSQSDAIFLEQEGMVEIQATWTGSPVGNFTLETSADQGNQNVYPPTGITNWSTYTGSSQAAGGAGGSFSWRIIQSPSRWVRLVFTFTSGTGSVSARFQAKGQ